MATVFKNASNCPTGYALNSVISCETDGAKVTLALAVTPPATAPTDPLNYKMDTGDFGTSNSFTAVPFGAHTFVLRIGGPDQASCYYAKTNVAADFNNCSALPCDNISLLAKDQAGTETTIIPRQTGTNALKNLTLSAATYDDSPLLGVTYSWTGPNNFTATTASIQAGMIGTYKLTLTRGTSTCSQEIALSAMPCAALPATGVNCSNEHLTGIADDPTNRLTALNPGDVVQAGDFEVTIIEAEGDKDGWTGKGYVKVPYLQAQVSIILTNAVFNSCYQLTNANATADNATVITEFDPNWENMIDVDDVLPIFRESFQQVLLNMKEIFEYQNIDCDKITAIIEYKNTLKQQLLVDNINFSDEERAILLQKIDELDNVIATLKSCLNCSTSSLRVARISTQDCGPYNKNCINKISQILQALSKGWPVTWDQFDIKTFMLKMKASSQTGIPMNLFLQSGTYKKSIEIPSQVIVDTQLTLTSKMDFIWNSNGSISGSPFNTTLYSVQYISDQIGDITWRYGSNNITIRIYDDTHDDLVERITQITKWLFPVQNKTTKTVVCTGGQPGIDLTVADIVNVFPDAVSTY